MMGDGMCMSVEGADAKLIATGLLRHSGARRRVLAGACVLVVGVVVMGWGPMAGFLEDRPWLFLGYWLGVCVGVILLCWLALYDMAMHVRDYRKSQRELVEQRDAELREAVERMGEDGA
jgi:uncharacterized membrane protein